MAVYVAARGESKVNIMGGPTDRQRWPTANRCRTTHYGQTGRVRCV